MRWHEIAIESIVWWWDVASGSRIRSNTKTDLFAPPEALMTVALMGCGRRVIRKGSWTLWEDVVRDLGETWWCVRLWGKVVRL
jgi:hypothetical protein